MKTKILLAAVAGALVLPVPMASQADVMSGMDFKISGRVAAGITRADSDKAGESATWDLGTTTDGDVRTDSRISLTADRETDIGTAGFKLERDWNTDGLTDVRHQYIYLGGDFGTFYVGNHDTPVGMGNGYDQSFFFGGGGRINDGDRRDGVGYTYSSGALSFGVTLHGESGNPATTPLARIADTDPMMMGNQQEADAAYINRLTAKDVPGSGEVNRNIDKTTGNVEGTPAYITRLEVLNAEATAANKRVADETIDTTIIGASYDFGVAKVGASYWKDNTESGHDSTSLMVSGDFGQLSYWVMYEAASDATTATTKDDIDGIGVHLGYALSDADNVWLQYGSRDYDIATKSDRTDVVVGYSHAFGGGATAVVEYHSRDNDDVGGTTNPDPSILHIGFHVSF